MGFPGVDSAVEVAILIGAVEAKEDVGGLGVGINADGEDATGVVVFAGVLRCGLVCGEKGVHFSRPSRDFRSGVGWCEHRLS